MKKKTLSAWSGAGPRAALEMRRLRGLRSRQQMADRLGVSMKTIQRAEAPRGPTEPVLTKARQCDAEDPGWKERKSDD